jgi:acyl carrier protein
VSPDRDEVIERLGRCLPRPVADLSPETEITRLGLDSIALLGMLCAIENEFGCEVKADALLVRGTVGEVADIVLESLAER